MFNGFDPVADGQYLKNIVDMAFYRAFSQLKHGSNLFIAVALRQQPNHGALALGQYCFIVVLCGGCFPGRNLD